MFANASNEVVLINFSVIFQFSRQKACKALAMNQFLLLAVAVIGSAQEANSVVYLRPKNDRGPSTCRNCLNLQRTVTITYIHFQAATKAGVDCLERIERQFFKNQYSEQVLNLAVFHSKKMTSPAMEIEIDYLFGLHDRVMNLDEDEDR